MAGGKCIALAFTALGKTGQATLHAQGIHALAASRQDFVCIGLVAHIPHQLVIGCVINKVQRNGKLHRAKIGRQMAAGFTH